MADIVRHDVEHFGSELIVSQEGGDEIVEHPAAGRANLKRLPEAIETAVDLAAGQEGEAEVRQARCRPSAGHSRGIRRPAAVEVAGDVLMNHSESIEVRDGHCSPLAHKIRSTRLCFRPSLASVRPRSSYPIMFGCYGLVREQNLSDNLPDFEQLALSADVKDR